MSWADPDPARRRGYHVGNLRAQLLDQARALLAQDGIAALNLRNLAAHVGIAPGSVYHHYASKSALLAGLASEGFGQLQAALDQAASAAGPGLTIRACAMAYFDFAQSQPATYALMFDPALLAEIEVAQARDAAFAVLERVIGAVASQRGLSADVTHKVALAVWACGHGAASMTPAGSEASLMEDVIQGLEHLFGRR